METYTAMIKLAEEAGMDEVRLLAVAFPAENWTKASEIAWDMVKPGEELVELRKHL